MNSIHKPPLPQWQVETAKPDRQQDQLRRHWPLSEAS